MNAWQGVVQFRALYIAGEIKKKNDMTGVKLKANGEYTPGGLINVCRPIVQ